MFKAVKLLNLDRKYEAIKVEDESGKTVAHPNEKLNIVTNFFESKFQNPNNTAKHHPKNSFNYRT